MISAFSLFFGIIISYNIFKNKANVVSLKWVIVGLLLINGMVIVTRVPIKMPIARWLMYSLLVTVLYYKYLINRNWRIFPFKNTIIVMIAASTIIGIVDPRLSFFYKLYNPFMEIVESYFILFLAYVTINEKEEVNRLDKTLFYCLVIITVYGLYNYVTKTNPYYMFALDHYSDDLCLTSFQKKVDVVADIYKERYRAVSTFSWTFQYGYASALLSLFFIYLYNGQVGSNLRNYIGAMMGFIGVNLCGSRTVFLAYAGSLSIFMLFSFKLSKKFKAIIIILVCVILSYQFIPAISDPIDRAVDVFITGGEKVGGSSISMRSGQLACAYKYFSQSPIVGNGYGYFLKELGWATRTSIVDKNMHGLEGIFLHLMVEQGLLGVLTKFLFFIHLICYFFVKLKNKQINNTAGFGLSIILCFFIFSVGTGAMGMWPITMCLLGAIAKSIHLNQRCPVRYS